MLIGPYVALAGLRCMWLKRRIENIPSSKVRSAAIGLVEMSGEAKARTMLSSPISQMPCCWWRCEIQELRRSKNSSQWVTLKSMESNDYFFLQDDTGRVLIDPRGADWQVDGVAFPLDGLTPQARSIISGWGVPLTNFLGFSRNLRFRESLLPERHPLLALGELAPLPASLSDRETALREALRKAKESPEIRAAIDTNRDGQLDLAEWDAYRLKLEREVLANERKEPGGAPATILKKPSSSQSIFFIVKGNEHDALTDLRWRGPLLMIFGLILVAAGVWVATVLNYPTGAIIVILVAGTLAGYLFSKKQGGLKWVLS